VQQTRMFTGCFAIPKVCPVPFGEGSFRSVGHE
jgi:hypothetical protein